MDRSTLNRITLHVALACAALTGLALVLGGVALAIGALVGGLVAVANWMAMRWVGRRLMVANDRGRIVWGTLLATKMAVLMAVVWAILSTGLVDPTGFSIGLGGLVVGVLTGTFHGALIPSESTASTEEQS